MSKVKVEIITNTSAYETEKDSNKFILKHNVKDIKFETAATAHCVYYTAFITYII